MTTLPEQARALANKTIDETVQYCLRGVRGCATDDQYQDAYDRIKAALDLAHADVAALREAAEAYIKDYEDPLQTCHNGYTYEKMQAALSTTAGRDMLERLGEAEEDRAKYLKAGGDFANLYVDARVRAEDAEARLAAAEADARRKALEEAIACARKHGDLLYSGSSMAAANIVKDGTVDHIVKALSALIAKEPTDAG